MAICPGEIRRGPRSALVSCHGCNLSSGTYVSSRASPSAIPACCSAGGKTRVRRRMGTSGGGFAASLVLARVIIGKPPSPRAGHIRSFRSQESSACQGGLIHQRDARVRLEFKADATQVRGFRHIERDAPPGSAGLRTETWARGCYMRAACRE